MIRINEHTFELNEEQYYLSFFDKPILMKNGVNQKVKPVLREYILKEKLPIMLFNSNGNEEVTWTLAKKILEYFSENSLKQSLNRDLIPKKKVGFESKHYKPIQNVSEKQELILSENFKFVMICAGSKFEEAELIYNNQHINFKALSNRQNFEFLPDDLVNVDETATWRDFINANQKIIPLMAYQLYCRREYRDLYNKCTDSMYILSAGWGLVRADFRMPKYDITFSNAANLENRRIYNHIHPAYIDFNQLINVDNEEDIIYIGGKDYLNLFYDLTQQLPNRKIIYYNSDNQPIQRNGNFIYKRYNTTTKTNWHYELANDISNGIMP